MIGYTTLSQAETYISAHYASSDPLRLAWIALSCSDKEAALLRSFEAIELLPFTGRRSQRAQTTAFPRWPDTEVPSAVVAAQIENAVAIADTTQLESSRHYAALKAAGISSYTIGNLSETFGNVSTAGISAAVMQQYGVVANKAQLLLQPYLGGGYRM